MDWFRLLDPERLVHYSNEKLVNMSIVDQAAIQGDLQLIQDYHYRDDSDTIVFTPNTMDEAAASGQLDIVIWLHENRYEGCTTNAMDWAAENGHLDVVKWLQEHVSLS